LGSKFNSVALIFEDILLDW